MFLENDELQLECMLKMPYWHQWTQHVLRIYNSRSSPVAWIPEMVALFDFWSLRLPASPSACTTSLSTRTPNNEHLGSNTLKFSGRPVASFTASKTLFQCALNEARSFQLHQIWLQTMPVDFYQKMQTKKGGCWPTLVSFRCPYNNLPLVVSPWTGLKVVSTMIHLAECKSGAKL